MVEEIFTTGSDDELSNLAQSQMNEASSGTQDSNQVMTTLLVINSLKVTVLIVIGAIMLQQIYYRFFAKDGAKSAQGRNKNVLNRNPNNRRQGQRPYTRAEALLVMLENNGCPPEQLQTLRNTVTNQDVKTIPPEDFVVEQKKRNDRRKEINRPKRSVMFALENNKTREFSIADVVQRDSKVIKSNERNQPMTPGRLVKIKHTSSTSTDTPEEMAATEPRSEDSKTENNGVTTSVANNQASGTDNTEAFETQSGDGSNQDGEKESGDEDQSAGVLPTLSEINNNQRDGDKKPEGLSEPAVKQGSPGQKPKKNKAPQFEEESKVLEVVPTSDDEISSQSTQPGAKEAAQVKK